jgi:phosphoglucomutase
MAAHPLAGRPAPPEQLLDLDRLIAAYYDQKPDPSVAGERVGFGTSGHRGSPFARAFNEDHVLAMTQAICDYRRREGITGPVYLGKDTHAASAPAERTALEVLAANGVECFVQESDGYTPTPVISRAILTHNRRGDGARADGIVVTPSHNPPEDGGFKYNPPHGGPADTETTRWIQERANALLESGVHDVRRIGHEAALHAATTHAVDLAGPYIEDLKYVLDLDAVRDARLELGVDPLGGASTHYWARIAERYGLDLSVVNSEVDPRFAFMPLDHDGKIRMDCSSPFAMRRLVDLRARYSVAFGNDPDADRHGIVSSAGGLLNPNHYLTIAVDYLFRHRPGWPVGARVGKTVVTSSFIDRVAASLGREVAETPVGFKWFVDGLVSRTLAFAGEESAGATLLCKDGGVWTTDKDGIALALLAAEIRAVTGRDLSDYVSDLEARFGKPYYVRLDAPATAAQKAALSRLEADAVRADTLAGEAIVERLTEAKAGGAIGGLKVVTQNGWFAARPSGTEDVYKIYAESFRSREHLDAIVTEAKALVDEALA